MAIKTPQHDLPPGPISCCQVCGSENLELVMDLGHQPLCDSLPSVEQLKQPEKTFPLRQLWCRDCTLSQIDYVVPGEEVYYPDYPYKSGVTRELVAYQKIMANEIVSDLGLARDSLVIDIGSNDGTLLTGFKDLGMRVVGVEPTNIAKLANEAGIPTVQSFFNEDCARRLVETYGKAKVVTATNVFAHMATLGQVIRALEILLADDGHFVLENHYALEVVRTGQYDTIYHEHLRTYTLRSLIKLFGFYDFTLRDARQVSRYGGNIRAYVARGRGRKVQPSVDDLLAKEKAAGLDQQASYDSFRNRADKAKFDLLRLAVQCRDEGKSFVGNSCPGRCSTLLNYCGIDRSMMPYICEQPTSRKLGLHLPGKQIPIVKNQRLIEEQPDYVVLLAWHYADSITQQLRAAGLRSKLVMPLPDVKILEP